MNLSLLLATAAIVTAAAEADTIDQYSLPVFKSILSRPPLTTFFRKDSSMRYFFYPITSLLFAIAPAAALHAATINETFSFANMSTYGFENGSNVAQFNPALGTLNSVSYSFTVTSTLNLPPVNNQANGYYFFELGPANNMQNITGQPVTFSGTITNAFFGFFAFTGTGSLIPSMAVQPFSGLDPGNGYSSAFSLGTVTYDYTPSATSAVPETSSFGLLGAGLVALGLLRRRSQLRCSIQEP